MLDEQIKRHERGEKHLSAFDMIKLITPMKKDSETAWLKEVSNASLQTVCRDLEQAYSGFFQKTHGFPKFKSRKRSRASFPLRCDGLYIYNEIFVTIAKIGKVKYKTDFNLPIGRDAKFTNPRISNDNGKWMLSFGLECENQARELTTKTMGIDLGVKDLAIAAFGDEQLVFHNINKSKRMRFLSRRLTHLQRTISRKYETNRNGKVYVKTRNIERAESRLRKLHARIANIRQNYIHQTTHTLIERLPKAVIMEDLNVSGMMKNKHLSRAIAQQGFYEFIRQMKYKCEWNGIEFVQVDRFYPSSKTCSSCGNIKHDLKLSDRTYVCEHCGAVIDRDYNAAINLSRYIA